MIKYHDNINGEQYGADHALTNNWNPDLDYGNEYVNVHFRINTNGYGYPSFNTDKESKSFEEDIKNVFNSIGWTCKEESHNGVCSTWYHGKSHLYFHPQDFSGEVLKNEVKTIAEALTDNCSFKLRWVDLYETVYDITDDEYEEILNAKDEEIKKVLLKNCKTKRTNQFYNMNNVVRVVADMFRVKRIDEADGKNCGIGQTGLHIVNVILSLIEAGYLVKCEMGKDIYIRTINKTEQKKTKLFIEE